MPFARPWEYVDLRLPTTANTDGENNQDSIFKLAGRYIFNRTKGGKVLLDKVTAQKQCERLCMADTTSLLTYAVNVMVGPTPSAMPRKGQMHYL
jgi:hypothetical protein